MYTNFIGLDPSLSCTAMCIDGKAFVYANEKISHTKKGSLTGWFEKYQKIGSLFTIKTNTIKQFSDSEISKIKYYDQITSQIIEDINNNVECIETTKCFIEGYSYSSNAGPLIDLVTFGSLLRHKLLQAGVLVEVIPPQSLKKKVCESIYSLKNPSSKPGGLIKNNNGVAGGNFKKHEMYEAILDCDEVDDWKKFIESLWEDVKNSKNVPKPIEDVNDAWHLYRLAKMGSTNINK